MSQPNSIFHEFWATRFYAFRWPGHEDHAPRLVEHLYSLRDQQKANVESGIAKSAKSGEGIFEGDFDLLEQQHDSIQALRAFITKSLQYAVADVNGREVKPDRIDVEYRDSWYHITNDGGFHDAHVHGGCSWCGIYYVQIGDSGQKVGDGAPNGANRFYSPHWSGGSHNDYGNKYLSSVYVDPPIQDGMLLLFPSFLKHSALPYRGEQDRIIVSFNSRSRLKAE